jgi:hypothetical protein
MLQVHLGHVTSKHWPQHMLCYCTVCVADLLQPVSLPKHGTLPLLLFCCYSVQKASSGKVEVTSSVYEVTACSCESGEGYMCLQEGNICVARVKCCGDLHCSSTAVHSMLQRVQTGSLLHIGVAYKCHDGSC